ncbi:plasmid partitioning protein RepB [Mesorhizobium sp. M1C.F.Ca.ET.193.01.1.1]|uniref:plasmid partitioning protein RepB n=1 Tax=unclassified Mesorhizobium TaxID=325217 RepID=UPI000FD5C775|nr:MULTISPECIES: plasmid partitioning protein RepB [unclassified Mesorhizobium]TGS94448.1 plasmid partitioning protein RepB [bacterium M00.F.Ca.ET.177.01.1.1]TGQ51548.1 plasmid partitioning protein RepB [Mesorhizobium sp. M1C.F.Ca.ET.210.01.1.1]TGQ67776.1 plasmid partitioning protein RepB [Mesorhizobium sp. M1C.F.Ca.ET.212.01.1.1]TGR02369.1 plasmid partitioning protein RepB [Mesorhizobium sp. M1C.F.Ca.ET.204.01.1.1]TGR22911.1 plasmid partitioning protein RepB [Mesorhizobium sp. M1C.F.Ca.ET.196
MARKGLLAGILDEDEFTAVNSAETAAPLAARSGRGAFGMMSRAADEMATKVEAAQEIERKLLAGETVIEIDPDHLDSSFVIDRMDQDEGRFEDLVQAIGERGQDSPILVRPHPSTEGRYQIVFGHRRVKAAKALGRNVRAVVKPLSDRDHVVAQGQENTARADLSFIERALFAAKLAARGFDTQTIMSALSVNKTVVSKMASVTKQIPVEIIQAIGAARGTGRDRWYDLSVKCRVKGNLEKATRFVGKQKFLEVESDTRFSLLFNHLPGDEAIADHQAATTGSKSAVAPAWAPSDKSVRVTAKDTGKAFTLSLKERDGVRFGTWISENLELLYSEFRRSETSNTGE